MRSFFIVLLSLLFGMNAALAGGGYPMQYCDDVTNPTTCYYVTSTGLPITPTVGSIYTVSATTDLNLTGNRIFTHADIDQLGGVPINLGTGAISTGTQRFTLATDDPAVVDLAAIEVLITAGNVDLAAIEALLIASPAIPTLDDDYTAGSIALTATSAQFTLPTAGGAYVVCAVGNTAYVECGSDPTVVIAADGFTFVVSEGSCVGPMRLAGTKCAAKAATTAGYINYLSVD